MEDSEEGKRGRIWEMKVASRRVIKEGESSFAALEYLNKNLNKYLVGSCGHVTHTIIHQNCY